MFDLGKAVLLIVFVGVSPLTVRVCGADHGDAAVDPVDLSAADLATFYRIHWHAFRYTLPEAPSVIGYELVTYAEGRATVIPGLSDQSSSARRPEHHFAVLYRESPDRSKLEMTVRLDMLSAFHEIDNPFAGLSMVTLKSSAIDENGRVVLAIALRPDDTSVSAEDKVPETAYRCLAIRIRPQKRGAALSFNTRQRQLFYEIDHKAVYDACQELMRLSREGKLSANAYHCDDPADKLGELPEAILAIEPTSIAINEVMMSLIFVSDDGTQHLRCMSNEFGEPPAAGDAKGLGFRTDPYAMDRLTGDESLDALNENYTHFHMSLFPGLQYEYYGDEAPVTVEGAKETAEGLAGLTDLIHTMGTELALKRQRLLYRVDHQKLLDACWVLLKRHDEGVFSSDQIHIVPEKFKDQMKGTVEYRQTEENIEHIPQIILDLEPGYVWFLGDSVMVAIAGGLDHAGVNAYADGVEHELDDDEMRLVDGLVYYDDGLREAGEPYKEYLRSLREEVTLYIDWMRKQKDLPIPARAPLN